MVTAEYNMYQMLTCFLWVKKIDDFYPFCSLFNVSSQLQHCAYGIGNSYYEFSLYKVSRNVTIR
jgi:hypothetical protein